MLWREIGDTIEKEIREGVLAPGGKIPADVDLAARFAVNRHTVRRALSDLRSRGLVRSLQGKGTFVVEDALTVHLAAQTRFEEDLLGANRIPQRKLLTVTTLAAPTDVASYLKLDTGAEILMTTSIGEANDVPIHLARFYFAIERAPTLAHGFRDLAATPDASFSLHKSMAFAGIPDYRRAHIQIGCRLPSADEAARLKMGTNEPVMETKIVNVLPDGTPIFYAVTLHAGNRVNFVVEP